VLLELARRYADIIQTVAVERFRLGRAFGLAYDSRTKGDYEDLAHFERDHVFEMLSEAERFIRTISSEVFHFAATACHLMTCQALVICQWKRHLCCGKACNRC
jgi:hypothetical protein